MIKSVLGRVTLSTLSKDKNKRIAELCADICCIYKTIGEEFGLDIELDIHENVENLRLSDIKKEINK